MARLPSQTSKILSNLFICSLDGWRILDHGEITLSDFKNIVQSVHLLFRWLEKVFKRTVGDHGEITLSDFKNIVQSKNVSFYLSF
jgi:hypothetical protein